MARPKLTLFLDVVSPFGYMAFYLTRVCYAFMAISSYGQLLVAIALLTGDPNMAAIVLGVLRALMACMNDVLARSTLLWRFLCSVIDRGNIVAILWSLVCLARS